MKNIIDFYQFVNSRDIRKHLQDMDYEFNALEASWLVYQCDAATIEDKHRAWTWIIENMPDMVVIKRFNCVYRESLHDTLKKYMSMEDELLNDFMNINDGIYTCEYYVDGETEKSNKVYFSIDDCIEDVKENWDLYDEEDVKYGAYADVTCHIKDRKYSITACYDRDCKIRSIDIYGTAPNSDYDDLLCYFFDGMWFDFPTPFKKGDVVCMYDLDPDGPKAFDLCRGLFVLEGIITWDLKEEGPRSRENYINGKCGDTSDMTAYGYFMNEDGGIYHECTFNYMNLEIYRGKYDGIRRIYKALSNFIKGKIDIELLLYAYTKIRAERLEEDLSANWFTDDGLKLAGLLE